MGPGNFAGYHSRLQLLRGAAKRRHLLGAHCGRPAVLSTSRGPEGSAAKKPRSS